MSGEATDPACGLLSCRARALDQSRPPLPRPRAPRLARRARRRRLAAAALPKHLSNVFTVPGTESDPARQILQRHFGERPDGVFTVVFRAHRDATRRPRSGALDARRALVPGGARVAAARRRRSPLRRDRLDARPAAREGLHRRAPPRARRRAARVRHRASPRSSTTSSRSSRTTCCRGEAIALPIALARPPRGARPLARRARAVRVRRLHDHRHARRRLRARARRSRWSATSRTSSSSSGSASRSTTRCSSSTASGRSSRATRDVDGAIVRTMATAGRSVLFSGATVAIGLALLLFVPVPFVRSLGDRRLPRPARLDGRRRDAAAGAALGARRARHAPDRAAAGRARPRPRLLGAARRARSCAAPCASSPSARACSSPRAVPAAWLQVTPGSISALPTGHRLGARASQLLRDRAGAGALTPIEIVVDTGRAGGVRTPELKRAVTRLANATFHDPEAYVTASGPQAPYVDPTGATRACTSSAATSTARESRRSCARIRSTTTSRARASRRRPRLRRRRARPGRRLSSPLVHVVPVARRSPRSSSRTSFCCARSARCSFR